MCVVWFLPVHGRGVPWACPGIPRRVCSGVGGGLRLCPGYAKKGGGTLWCPLPVRFGCGGVLLSHTLPGAVPSPCQVLASGFGMGPGVSPGPWPPQIFCYPSHGPRLRVFPRGFVWWVGDRIVDATEGMIHVTCRVSPCRPNDACSCHPSWGDCVVLPFDC